MLSRFVRSELLKMSQLPGISAGFVTSDQDKKDIFKLRYDVMVNNTTTFPKTHYCIHNNSEFRDDYDELPSTKHYLVRKDGVAVASCRLVDRNNVIFEAEKFNWCQVSSLLTPTHTNPTNVAEPTRVVVCKSVRKTHIFVFMLADTLLYMHDKKFESILGVVNANAGSLIGHYQKFMPSFHQMSQPFKVDEFIPGRSCNAYNLYIGTTDEHRNWFVHRTIFPISMYAKLLSRPSFSLPTWHYKENC